jgi:hypothetical protein
LRRSNPQISTAFNTLKFSDVESWNNLLFVRRPTDLPEYVHELTTFPKGKHDDQADSTSQALDWVRQGYWGPGMGIFNYYRIAPEKMMKEQRAR